MLSDIDWTTPQEDLFPVLFKHTPASRRENLHDALDIAAEGDSDEKITASRLSTIKDIVGRAVERAWSEDIYEKILLPVYRESISSRKNNSPIFEAFNYRNVHTLHDVMSVKKKVDTARKKGEFTGRDADAANAIMAFHKEIYPLAALASELKGHIFKKEAIARPKSTNMHQVRGNCSCCKSDVAVDNNGEGGIAHHGYNRPGGGFQTSSCFGQGYPPLQTSNAGLVAFRDYLERRLAETVERLEKADSLSVIMVPQRNGRSLTIRPDDEKWSKVLATYKTNTADKIERIGHNLSRVKQDIDNWETEWKGMPLRDVYGKNIEPTEPALSPSKPKKAPAPGPGI